MGRGLGYNVKISQKQRKGCWSFDRVWQMPLQRNMYLSSQMEGERKRKIEEEKRGSRGMRKEREQGCLLWVCGLTFRGLLLLLFSPGSGEHSHRSECGLF